MSTTDDGPRPPELTPPRRFGTVRLAAYGQIDAGMASLATFVLHLWVVREFSLAQIGAWALVFGAFVDVSQVAAQLFLTPVEIAAVRLDRAMRPGVLRTSIGRGLALSAATSILVALGSVPLVGDIDGSFLLALVLTGMAACVVSPIQDHVRKVMHLAGRSAVAATMSTVQLSAVVAGLLLAPDDLVALTPLGSLAVANVVSAIVGVSLVRAWRAERVATPGIRSASGVGGWLMGGTVANGLSGYFASVLIKSLTSVETLGMVEAARVIARPINVVGQGVNSVLSPRSMEAAVRGDLAGARRARRTFLVVFSAVSVPLFLLIGLPVTRDLAARLLPAALEDPPLAFSTLVAFWLLSLYLPFNSELLGGGRQRAWATATAVIAAVQLLSVVVFAGMGAFVFPVSIGLAALVRLPVFAVLVRRLYASTRRGAHRR